MSDYDRSRRRKKRSSYGTKENDDYGLSSTMVILAKPQQEQTAPANSSTALSDPGSSNNSGDGKHTVLLKSQTKSDASSTQTSTGTSGHSETGSAATATGNTPVYQLQQKQHSASDGGSLEQKLSPPPDMLAPVKLVDEAMSWCDNAMEFLQDQNDFYVVGVLGLQGCGKSTVLSLLNGQYHYGRQIFKAQTDELCELGAHCTNGVSVYITNERVILLDTQPVLSASVMDRIIQYEKKLIGGQEYTSTENALQMQSLQVASFLMAVCHTIILVQDWFTDANLLRFVQSAEMLKPATPSNAHEMAGFVDDMLEHYPHFVFVQNKCNTSDFSPAAVTEMDRTLRIVFGKSRLKFQGYVSPDPEAQNDGTSDDVNLFLLPNRSLQDQDSVLDYKGHPGFKELAASFAHQMLSMPPTLLTRTTISEKNWFHYAARIWEAVKKSNLFLEYNRLLP